MADQPKKNGTVPLTGPMVKQHKRMAAGEKITGPKLPAAPSTPKPQA